jgi:hypothetical protein
MVEQQQGLASIRDRCEPASHRRRLSVLDDLARTLPSRSLGGFQNLIIHIYLKSDSLFALLLACSSTTIMANDRDRDQERRRHDTGYICPVNAEHRY